MGTHLEGRGPGSRDWSWACPRLTPLIARTHLDAIGDGPVRVVSELGCAVVFGIRSGREYELLSRRAAERWERLPAELLHAGLDNLARRARRLQPRHVAAGALYGHLIRHLSLPRGCAASMVLLPDELVRLFGDHDQLFVAPSAGLIVSFPIDIPAQLAVDATVALEKRAEMPLLVDPFVLRDGELRWLGTAAPAPGTDRGTRRLPLDP